MKAGDEKLGTVFNMDHRYVIPIFQRPYVWAEEENWQPLWDDLRAAAEAAELEAERAEAYDGDLEAAGPPTEYFLGAFVTQPRSAVPKRMPSSTVIDGQQRLTTFQVFLAAARRVAGELGATHAVDSFTTLTRNRVSSDTDHPEDVWKVAPLHHDEAAFRWAMRGSDQAATPAPNPAHRIAKAADWFEDAVRDWAREHGNPADRLDWLHFAVENRIKVVSVYLDAHDDPQVIFEALNHRGVRLDAADLIKNLLFQALDRQGDRAREQELLQDHWRPLDGDHWRQEITTGRIHRVRVDVLLAYWLSIQRGETISVEHLFDEFKRWMKTSGARAADVIVDVRRHADTYDRLVRLPISDPVAQVVDRLEVTNTTTPWPLLLYLFTAPGIPTEQASLAAAAVDSYLMRRAICGMGTKDYTNVFAQVLAAVTSAPPDAAGQAVRLALAKQTAPGRLWPDDSEFITGLLRSDLYTGIVRARVRALLVGLENHLLTARTEKDTPFSARSGLTIEHVMPQKWTKNWPLPAGLPEGEVEAATQSRDAKVHTLGNLTLATKKLNEEMSNSAWATKRKALQTHSLVRLTTASVLAPPEGTAHDHDEWVSSWDEDHIGLRSIYLAHHALRTWPGATEEEQAAAGTGGGSGEDVEVDVVDVPAPGHHPTP